MTLIAQPNKSCRGIHFGKCLVQQTVSLAIMGAFKTSKAVEKRRYLRFVVNNIVLATFFTFGGQESSETEINAIHKSWLSKDLETLLIRKSNTEKLSTTFE